MRTLFTALAVAAAVVAPAQAQHHTAGLLCQWAFVGDPTGVAEPDYRRNYGWLSGGPVVVDSPDLVVSTTLTCSLQVNDDRPEAPDAARAAGTTSGPVGWLRPTPAMLVAEPTDNVYGCVRLSWTTADGTVHVHDWDFDRHLPGPQCCLPVGDDTCGGW